MYVVKAFTRRDGGWTRTLGSFKLENDAWTAIDLFTAMIKEAGDYEDIFVRRTIKFRNERRRRRKWWKI